MSAHDHDFRAAVGLAFDESGQLDGCESCLAIHDAARAARAKLSRQEAPGEEVWAGIQQRIVTDRARAELRVVMGCAFCHDRLLRPAAVYCATCLAPHHEECFREHGRCSAPGCGETSLVRSQPVAPRRRRWPWLLGAGFLAGAAALNGIARDRAPASRGAAQVSSPSSGETPASERSSPVSVELDSGTGLFDVSARDVALSHLLLLLDQLSDVDLVYGDVVGTVSLEVRKRTLREVLDFAAEQIAFEIIERSDGALIVLQERRVDLSYRDEDLRVVLQDLARQGGVNIIVSPEVTGLVTMELKDVHWLRALYAVVNTAGQYAVVQESEDVYRVVSLDSIELQLETVTFPVGELSPADVEALLPHLRTATEIDQVKGASLAYLPERKVLVALGSKPALQMIQRVLSKVSGEADPSSAPGRARVLALELPTHAHTESLLERLRAALGGAVECRYLPGTAQLILFGAEADIERAERELDTWLEEEGLERAG